MALIKCKECGTEISSTASNCPRCGYRTEHGKSQTQSIVDLISLLLLFAGICLGLYWFFANIETVGYIFKLLEDYDYYSKYYGVLEYLEYKFADEAVAALWEFMAGIVLIVCGLIGMHSLKKEVEKRKRAYVRVISSYYKTEPAQPQKASSDVRWECAHCHSTNPPAAQACTRCGANRPATKWYCKGCGTMTDGEDECEFCGAIKPLVITSVQSVAPNMRTGPVGNDEWRCSCGRVNKKYVTTCACGKNRSGSTAQLAKETAPVMETNDKATCPKCGNAYGKDSKFCTGCGTKL